MNAVAGTFIDGMQVCHNGHVVTDRLATCPDQARGFCDRCGAATLDQCVTCGTPLSAAHLPGLFPVATPRPPRCCIACGAVFPWARPRPSSLPAPLPTLEALLRRLPRVARELRSRHGDRPPFAIRDIHDLEDLLRALLPISFDDCRLEARTPSYAPGRRTDFLLVPHGVALTTKHVSAAQARQELVSQWPEDLAYYRGRIQVQTLIGFVYDPEGLLRDPAQLEIAWSCSDDAPELRSIIAV